MQDYVIKHQEMDFRTREAFKTLRTNIEFSGEDIKVIAVTSAMPNEGKSSVSFELALSFAQAGKRTLLVDADLRKSVMSSRRKKGRVKYGLTNYLVGKKEFLDVLCSSDVPNFYTVFAGPVPPNPCELLGGEKFRDMVQDARSAFDIVIIDTPPVGSVIDAAVVSKCCDGVIVVMASGKISYQFARKVKNQLEVADARILGCVLNRVDLSGKGYYGKYYGKYYGRYYGEE